MARKLEMWKLYRQGGSKPVNQGELIKDQIGREWVIMITHCVKNFYDEPGLITVYPSRKRAKTKQYFTPFFPELEWRWVPVLQEAE